MFSLEDFYIFILAHEYSHYINGGTGLRSLTDLFIFHKNFEKSINWEYVKTELEKLRISQFWKDNYSLSEHLFGNGVKIDNNQEEMLEYILSSGTYGSLQNKVDNKINRFGGGMIGRLGYVVHRIILPMEAVKYCFPTFYKYKILMVFLPLYRIVIGLSNNRRSLSAEWKALKSSS